MEEIHNDVWVLIDEAPRKPWAIQPVISSEDCPHRYRKWRPVQKGFFCKFRGGKKCIEDKCEFRVRV